MEKEEEEVQTKGYRREAGVELRGMWKIMQKGERKGDAADQRRKGIGAQMKAVVWRKVG